MVLEIVKWPTPILETPSEKVTAFDQEFVDFVESMKATMNANHGIGLAANQVGVAKRVFVVHIPFVEGSEDGQGVKSEKQSWHDKTFVFVNPEIVRESGRVKSMEGCLSFPDIYEYVTRSEKVRVRAQDEHGEAFELEASDLFSICIQHELDHINGIVFTKRMSRLKASIVKAKLRKAGGFHL